MQEPTQANRLSDDQIYKFLFFLIILNVLYDTYFYFSERGFNLSRFAHNFELSQDMRKTLHELNNNLQSIIRFLIYLPQGALAGLFFPDVIIRVIENLYKRWVDASQRAELEDRINYPHLHELGERLFGPDPIDQQAEIFAVNNDEEENDLLPQNPPIVFGVAMARFGIHPVQHRNAQQRLDDYINQIDDDNDQEEPLESVRHLYMNPRPF